MITYLVTIKQQVVHEHTQVIEVDASSPEEAREIAYEMISSGEVQIDHHLGATGFIKEPEITDVSPIAECDETV